MHRQGVRFWDTGFGPLIVLNLVIDVFIPNVSIGGHIGGIIAGALMAEIMIRARKLEMPALGYVGARVMALASVAIAFAASAR